MMVLQIKHKRIEPEISPENDSEIFWYWKITNKNGGEWKIDHLKFIRFLVSKGFHRFDVGKNYIFVYIVDRVVEEATVTEIQDFLIKYIETIDDEYLGAEGKGIDKPTLVGKFFTSPATYFNEKKLTLLGVEPNLRVQNDLKESCFIYFDNGFVEYTSSGYQLKNYTELAGYVFKNQIKNRSFKRHAVDGMFAKFVHNICGSDDRYLAFRTMIGYLLHGFFEAKMKAVNLTDSTISDVAEGRTGKTLIGKAISKIKNVCEISGKDFDPTNKHKYSSASLDSQIVFLNDLRKNFVFEHLFNDISEAITVDRKNMQPFTIRAKMLIASNDTFRVEGASAKDRIIEFELTNHYNADFSPIDEFGCWFFTDWSESEWLAFDNWMMESISLFLAQGVIEAQSINLQKRKQIQHTNRDVVEFLDGLLENGELKRGAEFDKKELHDRFLQQYPEYNEDRWLRRTANFTKYIKTYASYCPDLSGNISERRSNGQSFIRFDKLQNNDWAELPFENK